MVEITEAARFGKIRSGNILVEQKILKMEEVNGSHVLSVNGR